MSRIYPPHASSNTSRIEVCLPYILAGTERHSVLYRMFGSDVKRIWEGDFFPVRVFADAYDNLGYVLAVHDRKLITLYPKVCNVIDCLPDNESYLFVPSTSILSWRIDGDSLVYGRVYGNIEERVPLKIQSWEERIVVTKSGRVITLTVANSEKRLVYLSLSGQAEMLPRESAKFCSATTFLQYADCTLDSTRVMTIDGTEMGTMKTTGRATFHVGAMIEEDTAVGSFICPVGWYGAICVFKREEKESNKRAWKLVWAGGDFAPFSQVFAKRPWIYALVPWGERKMVHVFGWSGWYECSYMFSPDTYQDVQPMQYKVLDLADRIVALLADGKTHIPQKDEYRFPHMLSFLVQNNELTRAILEKTKWAPSSVQFESSPAT